MFWRLAPANRTIKTIPSHLFVYFFFLRLEFILDDTFPPLAETGYFLYAFYQTDRWYCFKLGTASTTEAFSFQTQSVSHVDENSFRPLFTKCRLGFQELEVQKRKGMPWVIMGMNEKGQQKNNTARSRRELIVGWFDDIHLLVYKPFPQA